MRAFVSAALIIANAAVIWSPFFRDNTRIDLGRDLFLLFGVFSYYETMNHELRIWGSHGEVDDVGKEKWQMISTEEHFPFSRGARQSRLWASHHLRDRTREEHWRVWQDMGEKIRVRHNRLHPENAITRVGFQSRSWPRSSGGYYDKVNEARVTRFWVVASNKQVRSTELNSEAPNEVLPYRE